MLLFMPKSLSFLVKSILLTKSNASLMSNYAMWTDYFFDFAYYKTV